MFQRVIIFIWIYMRFRNLDKWDEPQKCSGLIYFAQLLSEMLFDFSLDTYKASVMNTALLCREALQTIKEVQAGNIKPPNVGHVIDEFCASFEKDPVAQALVPLSASAFFSTLKNQKSSLKELQTILELLAVQLTARRFREKNEELLAEEICGRQSIPQIRRLARSYVTTLMATGFSQKFLEEVTLDFFHYGNNRIGSSTAIWDFLARFPYEMGEFIVVFRVDPIFEHLTETLTQIGLTITGDLSNEIDVSEFHAFAVTGAERLFAISPKLAARDIYSARSAAEKNLKLGATLLTLFHHKEHPNWRPECIAIDIKKQQSKLISKPINAMHKCADLKQPVASKKLQLFMNDFSLDKDSFSKFVRSAQLHSMALASNAEENQILNLWISLESLIPSETKNDDVSNIEHIIASLLPFLNGSYIERLLNNLVKDLLRWNSPIVKSMLRTIPGKKSSDRLAKLLALPEFAASRVTMETHLRDFHLLRDRVDHFRDVLSSPAKVIAALDAHRIRLEWQIRRIYRTRNIIVHSGDTPSYTHLLIAHAHDYLDTVLSSLVSLASKPKTINSVSQGFMFAGLKYSRYYKNLSEKGVIFDITNVDALLFNR